MTWRTYTVINDEQYYVYDGFDKNFKSDHVLLLVQCEDSIEAWALDSELDLVEFMRYHDDYGMAHARVIGLYPGNVGIDVSQLKASTQNEYKNHELMNNHYWTIKKFNLEGTQQMCFLFREVPEEHFFHKHGLRNCVWQFESNLTNKFVVRMRIYTDTTLDVACSSMKADFPISISKIKQTVEELERQYCDMIESE